MQCFDFCLVRLILITILRPFDLYNDFFLFPKLVRLISGTIFSNLKIFPFDF